MRSMPPGILSFAKKITRIDFDLPPQDAIDFFKSKGMKISFDWRDMLREEHDAAFTIAKMMDIDLLQTVRKAIDDAISNGTTFAEFRNQLQPILQDAGWWGRGDAGQLGSAYRLQTIFRSNMQSAYSVGHWIQIEENKEDAPFLMYDAVDDNRTRELHAEMDNLVLPVNSTFWDSFMPPNGWNCRCGVIQLSQDDLDELGITVSDEPEIKDRVWTNPRTGKKHTVPLAIDPGWEHNPGKARMDRLKAIEGEKITALPDDVLARIAALNKDDLDRVRSAYLDVAGLSPSTLDRISEPLTDVLIEKSITLAEFTALRIYTSSFFDTLNPALRGTIGYSTLEMDELLFTAGKINSVIGKLDKFTGSKVYRTLKITEGRDLQNFIVKINQHIADGTPFSDGGFVSTSSGLAQAYVGNVNIVIRNPKTGAYIDDLSYNRGEKEVLFPTTAKFKVVDIDYNAKTYTIVMEEI